MTEPTQTNTEKLDKLLAEGRGQIQCEGNVLAELVQHLAKAGGWSRNKKHEGYSNLYVQAYTHETLPGRVEMTVGNCMGTFTAVERFPR